MTEIEKGRKSYHSNATRNSVHRASLLVPNFKGTTAQVSFLNHFLIKRGYEDVTCRITGVDQEGERLYSELFEITERKVYSFNLNEIFGDEASSYHVEFFTGKNLFIPFPAVMVNHYAKGFINAVHAYNRVLNDVFEDDLINANSVKEASVDVYLNSDIETFVTIHAGPFSCKGELSLELATKNEEYTAEKVVDIKRFTTETFLISDLFPKLDTIEGGVLKIRQPDQQMFYGRLLAGQKMRKSAHFSANHSYYDSSSVEEYWKEGYPSEQCYPFFKNYKNIIRMYPIQSPGLLNLSVIFYHRDGHELKKVSCGELKSPGSEFLEIDINNLMTDNKINADEITTYSFVASSNGPIPTRVNHQLSFAKEENKLFSSINLSLPNKEVFNPASKKGFRWGQLLCGNDIVSELGICFKFPNEDQEKQNVKITFFDESGEINSLEEMLSPKESLFFSTEEEWAQDKMGAECEIKNVWFTVESDRPDMGVIIVTHNESTNNCTGEHGF